MPCKNTKPASVDMAVDRWVTGFVGGGVVLAMLYYSLWHFLVCIIGVFLVWECLKAFPQNSLKILSLCYVAASLLCLWDAPWILLPLVWANDTGAYFVGRWLQGPKLCPRVSPAKTWSGLVGGVMCGVLLFFVVSQLLPFNIPQWSLWFVGVLSLAGHLGDLVESWAKRRSGIKDTASYLPGHGGFLDRFDSLLGMGLAYALLKVLFL